jgi:ABC-type phosphate transport system permease subunit
LAGPLLSLIQGLIIGWVYLKSQKQTLLQLLLLWLSVLGFTNFFGYLMTGPLFEMGDIGKVFLLLNVPFFIQTIIAVLGAAILLFIAYRLTTPFLQFSFKQKWVFDQKSRKNFSFGIIILPWIMGSIIVTILYLPIVVIVSIIYPIMSGMIFIFPWQNAQRVENVRLANNNTIGEPSILVYLSLVVLIIGFKYILAPGIQL